MFLLERVVLPDGPVVIGVTVRHVACTRLFYLQLLLAGHLLETLWLGVVHSAQVFRPVLSVLLVRLNHPVLNQ